MKIIFYLVFVISFVIVKADNENGKVDPKLDLQESKEVTTDKTSTVQSNTDKKILSPKIHGVRVTVDTGNSKQSKEVNSNENIEIVDSKKTRKIGIHTDITFEITGDKDNSNSTNSSSDDDNASVPIFKGYGSHHNHDRDDSKKNKKPYDPRFNQPINPNRFYPNPVNDNSDNHYYPSSRNSPPVIYARPRSRNDYDIYRSIDNWSNYVPITRVWTTERTYYPSSITNYQSHQEPQLPEWKPCYCITDITNGRSGWKHKRSSSSIKVNNKLEKYFSQGKKI